MSIASEILSIKNNIASAYTSCNNRGATMPSSQNSNNLANTINSITGINRGVSSNGGYGYPTRNFKFVLPSNATSIDEGMLKNAFEGCTTLTEVDMSSLIEISGSSALNSFCNGFTNLTKVDLSSLQTASGTSMTNAFRDCPNIASIDLSALTTLASGVSLNGTFSLDSNPSSTLPLTSVTFTSLASISGTAPMRNIFAKRDGLVVYFPALNSNSFGNLTTYLDNIVSGAVGCTVHFPSNMQSIIGSWSSVQNGFGGTNTTVLFDLPATT